MFRNRIHIPDRNDNYLIYLLIYLSNNEHPEIKHLFGDVNTGIKPLISEYEKEFNRIRNDLVENNEHKRITISQLYRYLWNSI